ncbi:terminase [Parabacteroides sp. ZJ-118]|uniref:terminase n=1 Tax=Parabacteroides sp. ZJ-118 TaxID=2709398 RepID=UPI0013E9F59E|nr:terminase [Parabacteroides sp. ZJ-118]
MEEMRRNDIPIRIILLKARQWGGSTLVQLYMAWIQLFVAEGWYSVIIAQTKDTARRIKAMYKKVLDNIPGFIYGVGKIQFSPYEHSASDSIITDQSGNKIRDNVITVASYENFESTRGMDYAMAHFSEVAYWRTTDSKSAEQVITNIDSNILERPLTMEISESTANGMSGYFYDEYQMAKEGTSSRKALFIPFFYIENDMISFKDKREARIFILELLANKDVKTPKDDNSEPGQYLYSLWEKGATLEHIKWYIKKRSSFHDHASMASEAPSDDVECFKYSGNLVFNIYTIEVMRDRYVCPPVFIGDISQSDKGKRRIILTKDDNGSLRIWKKPDDTMTANEYLVVVDVGGRGKGSDPSCITVINRWNLRFSGGKPEVVARWHGHMRYDFLAYKAVKIAIYYKNALLAFESNTFDKKKSEASEFVEEGDHIRGILKKVEDIYPNLYKRTATDPEDIRNGIYKKIGFQTNKKTKQDMVDNFIVAFEDDMFIDPDER